MKKNIVCIIITNIIQGDSILEASREPLNIFCWNSECPYCLGLVQTLLEFAVLPNQSKRTLSFDFQIEHPASNLNFEFFAGRLVIILIQ